MTHSIQSFLSSLRSQFKLRSKRRRRRSSPLSVELLGERNLLSVGIGDIGLLNGFIDGEGQWVGEDPTIAVEVQDAPSSEIIRLEFDHNGDGVAEDAVNQAGSETGFVYDPRSVDPYIAGASQVSVRVLVLSSADESVLEDSGWSAFEFYVNRPPMAADQGYEVDQDECLSGSGLLNDASDPDGHDLVVVEETKETTEGGSVTIYSDGSFTYTPATGFSGTDSFEFWVDDGHGGQSSAFAYVDVAAAPEIIAFDIDWGGSVDFDYLFAGTAIGNYISGATVTFGGLLEGYSATIDEYGNFYVTATFTETTIGEVTATITDGHNRESALFGCDIEIYV